MIEINLLPEELKSKIASRKKLAIKVAPNKALYALPVIFTLVLLLHILLLAQSTLTAGRYRSFSSQWNALETQRKELAEFKKEYGVFSEASQAIQQLIKKRILWSRKLNKLSLNLPPGVWFREFSFKGQECDLQASSISLQADEMNIINRFAQALKSDPEFFEDFENLKLGSVQKRKIATYEVTDFILKAAVKPR